MITDLELLQAIASGEILATHRGHDYVKVCAVFRLPHDASSPAAFYCVDSAWPTTPMGEIASRDREIAQLQSRVAELQRALTEARVPPAVAAAATGMEAPPAAEAEAAFPCADCPRSFPSAKSLATHRQRKHSGKVWSTRPHTSAPETPPEAPPARPRLQVVEDSPNWSCAACGRTPGRDGAFSRSVTKPDLCMRCAAESQSAPSAAAIAA